MYRVTIILIFFFSSPLFAQISITSNDIFNLIGNTDYLMDDSSGTVDIDPGAAGENQMWDFSSLVLNGPSYSVNYISAAGTPFTGIFPSANFAVQQTFTEGDSSGSIYNYWEVTSSNIFSLGFGFVEEPSGNTFSESDPDTTELPLTYGMQWSSVTRDVTDAGGGTLIVEYDSTFSEVDAWGKITTPAGTFDALRIKDYFYEETFFLFDTLVLFADTSSFYNYQWVSKDHIFLAVIESQDGETDPNFTDAQYVSMLVDTKPTALGDNPQNYVAGNFTLNQNYPNPFNPSTVFSFELNQSSLVDLAVFNVHGQKVATLATGQLAKGSHQYAWNAADNASGIYYYRLTAGNNTVTKKCMFLK